MSQLVVLLLLKVLLGVVVIQANPTGRIVNGEKANFTQFSHQISLRLNHIHTCGGSIITRRSILTAAHCVVGKNGTIESAKNFTIRAGTINRIAGGVIVQVKNIKKHNETDLALLELEEDLQYSDKIRPIRMLDEEVPDQSDIIISGWGSTFNQEVGFSILLQYRHVKAISKSQCAKKILRYNDSLLCLDHEENAGACNGDAGGPATYKKQLVGVASLIVDKCGSSKPDTYTKVSRNIYWIRENII